MGIIDESLGLVTAVISGFVSVLLSGLITFVTPSSSLPPKLPDGIYRVERTPKQRPENIVVGHLAGRVEGRGSGWPPVLVDTCGTLVLLDEQPPTSCSDRRTRITTAFSSGKLQKLAAGYFRVGSRGVSTYLRTVSPLDMTGDWLVPSSSVRISSSFISFEFRNDCYYIRGSDCQYTHGAYLAAAGLMYFMDPVIIGQCRPGEEGLDLRFLRGGAWHGSPKMARTCI